ncbi:unnamed protein product, partial [Rotaria sordida]
MPSSPVQATLNEQLEQEKARNRKTSSPTGIEPLHLPTTISPPTALNSITT